MEIIKIIGPTVLTFFTGILITPIFTHYFYKYKMWKRSPRTNAGDITSNHFLEIHNTSHETSTPRVGGIIIWVSVLLTVFVIYLLSLIFPYDPIGKLNFFSRSQTVVPLGAFFFAAMVGLVDDLLQIFGQGTYAKDALVYRKVKIVFVTLIGLTIALWFYNKIDFNSIYVPFVGMWEIGVWFVPFFIVVMLATFSTSVIDGLDGLAGGVMASAFAAMSLIAFFGNQNFCPFRCDSWRYYGLSLVQCATCQVLYGGNGHARSHGSTCGAGFSY
jgi:phospho-N-acetylmuramoyl-pentapeptide-transferase